MLSKRMRRVTPLFALDNKHFYAIYIKPNTLVAKKFYEFRDLENTKMSNYGTVVNFAGAYRFANNFNELDNTQFIYYENIELILQDWDFYTLASSNKIMRFLDG